MHKKLGQKLTGKNLYADRQFFKECNPHFLMLLCLTYTAQKMKFSIKDFLGKCDQIRSFLRIWSLKKSLKENFIFCAVLIAWVGVIPILKKNSNPFALTQSKMIKWRFLYIPITPFYHNPPFCPPNPFLINHILFWKVKSSTPV